MGFSRGFPFMSFLYFAPFTALDEDFVVVAENFTIFTNDASGDFDFPINIVPDILVEGNHSFIVRLVNDGTFTLGDISDIEVIIIDNDSEFKVHPPHVYAIVYA